jgi:hypothetical protein
MITLKSLLQESVSRADLENPQFMSGVNLATQDAKEGKHRPLRGLPDDFVRGYKTVKRESTWMRINSWLTDLAAQFGSSLTNPTWRSKE